MNSTYHNQGFKWWQLLIVAGLWTVFYALLLQETFALNISTAFKESVGTNIVLAISLLISIRGLQYYQPSGDKVFVILFAAGVLSALVITIDRYIFSLFATAASEIVYMERSMMLHGGIAFLTNAAAISLSMQSNQFKEIEDAKEKSEQTLRVAKEAELMDLRHQLQPHFLFNSLNSINALIKSQPEKAREMIFQLSAFLRGSIRSDQTTLVSLKQEMEYIDLYLAIETVRFGHRLQTKISFPDDVLDRKLPPLLLQPLVENAIKFGLYGTTSNVEISINAIPKENELYISISNPFDSDADIQKGTGFGLVSIERRLNLIYGRNDLISKEAVDNQFTVTLKIPNK